MTLDTTQATLTGSKEPPVLRLVLTVSLIGGSVADNFYARVAEAMQTPATGFQSLSPSLQINVLALFATARPSVRCLSFWQN
jgi:hypothetical protein